MRIAMLSDDWWPVTGGGPAHVKSLSIALAKHFGDEVDVYTRQLRDGGRSYTATETYVDGRVRVIRLGPCTEFWNPIGRVASTLTPIPKLLANDYDVIHGHTYLPAIPLRLAGALTDIPTVFTVHGMPLTSEAGAGTGTESEIGETPSRDADAGLADRAGGSADRAGRSTDRTSRLADRVVGLTDDVADRVRERTISQLVLGFEFDSVISVNRTNVAHLEAHHDDVTFVPNGVDVERFHPEAAPDEKKVLYLGRLDPQKRVGDLIDAFAAVADEFPDRELVIVGSGRKEAELQQYAARSGVADRIRFTGKVPDEEVPRQYASAELFVLPSHWEGHPLSLLEAWASGVPVIASDVKGVREFVSHGENGYLVDPASPDALADGLRYALGHPDEARRWGREGRERVHEEFTWERCAARTRRAYASLTDGAPEREPEATTTLK